MICAVRPACATTHSFRTWVPSLTSFIIPHTKGKEVDVSSECVWCDGIVNEADGDKEQQVVSQHPANKSVPSGNRWSYRWVMDITIKLLVTKI